MLNMLGEAQPASGWSKQGRGPSRDSAQCPDNNPHHQLSFHVHREHLSTQTALAVTKPHLEHKITESIQSKVSNTNRIKLEINNMTSEKSPNIWKPVNTGAKKKVSKEIRKLMKMKIQCITIYRVH